MAYIYRIPNRQVTETQAIQQLIRASNAQSIARRREQDELDRQASKATQRAIGRAFAFLVAQ